MQSCASEDLHNWLMSCEKNYEYVEFSNRLQYNEMGLSKPVNFDPTPRLKSSPIAIKFISFNENDDKCIYCEEEYIYTLFFTGQKYCKNCLSCYLNNITDNNMYLDVYYSTNLECVIKHEDMTKVSQVVQECCRNCLKVLCFKQIFESNTDRRSIESENYCELCENSICQEKNMLKMVQLKLPLDCYLTYTEYTESILTKKLIPVIYLPWWHNISSCVTCNKSLIFTSDCQKYCEGCLIFYIGCRYCLTTNIIFGLTTQSQCKKCKRLSSIIFDITIILSGNSELDDFILNLKPEIYNNLKIDDFSDKIKNNDKYFHPLEINSTIHSICQNHKDNQSENSIKWIPYSQFSKIKEIAKGGFGIIYHANWAHESVV
ncbi:hypothetical protein RclHR1_05500005 [Rhizophagus clarus]|nr:hypothetical protein RclHR1_05500005 [Rhizophagus clarus]